jgi:hypothetical protein
MGKSAAPNAVVKKAATKKPAGKKPSPAPKSALSKPKKAVSKQSATKGKKSAGKAPAASRKKKKQAGDDENENEDTEDEEEEPEVVAEDEADLADSPMPDAPKDNESLENDTDVKVSKRRNEKRRARAYRHIANKGGYSAAYCTSDQSRDVAANFITINETRRAATWKPKIDGVAAFENVEEFKERLAVANEPLPPRAAEVYRANLEVFMRKLEGDAMQTSFDAGSKKLKPEHVMPHTRKLQKHLKFTIIAPHCVIRYAQLQKDGERLRIPTSDQEALATEDPKLVEEQKDAIKAQSEANQSRIEKKLERIAASKKKKALVATPA